MDPSAFQLAPAEPDLSPPTRTTRLANCKSVLTVGQTLHQVHSAANTRPARKAQIAARAAIFSARAQIWFDARALDTARAPADCTRSGLVAASRLSSDRVQQYASASTKGPVVALGWQHRLANALANCPGNCGSPTTRPQKQQPPRATQHHTGAVR